MVLKGTKAYQPTESTADCLVNPVLRLAQVFVGYWLCQANTAASVTEAELYFLWCMMRKRKVITERIPKMSYCPQPEQFGRKFLTNVGVLAQKGGALRFYEVTKLGSQPVGAVKKKSKKKQLEVVVADTEKERSAPTEVATRTLRIQGDITMPSTSTAPEASPAHASFADMVGQMDPWMTRLEGLVERIALNTDRIAQSSEAQMQLLTAQTEAQMRYNEEVRTTVFTVRDMVSLMARELSQQQQRAPQQAPHGASSRHPTGRDDTHPRTADSRRDRPWR